MVYGGCHEDGFCLYTTESFNCTCKDGYEGDGFNCTGIIFFFFFLNSEIRKWYIKFQYRYQ